MVGRGLGWGALVYKQQSSDFCVGVTTQSKNNDFFSNFAETSGKYCNKIILNQTYNATFTLSHFSIILRSHPAEIKL